MIAFFLRSTTSFLFGTFFIIPSSSRNAPGPRAANSLVHDAPTTVLNKVQCSWGCIPHLYSYILYLYSRWPNNSICVLSDHKTLLQKSFLCPCGQLQTIVELVLILDQQTLVYHDGSWVVPDPPNQSPFSWNSQVSFSILCKVVATQNNSTCIYVLLFELLILESVVVWKLFQETFLTL